MKKNFQLNIPVESFVRCLITACNQSNQPKIREQTFSLFQLLCETGCDFYCALQLYSGLDKLSEQEIQIIFEVSPAPESILHPTSKDIRTALPRWTPTKYHTGPIDEIVEDVQNKIVTRTQGVYSYNSNLNPKNRRSLNDLYLLMIAGDIIRWYDINRRSTFRFVSE